MTSSFPEVTAPRVVDGSHHTPSVRKLQCILVKIMYTFFVDFGAVFHYNGMIMEVETCQGGRPMQETWETVPFEDVETARARYPIQRDWLTWVLDVAQTDLGALAPGRRRDLRVDVLAFLLEAHGREALEGAPEGRCRLPMDAELNRIQAMFRDVVRAVQTGTPLEMSEESCSLEEALGFTAELPHRRIPVRQLFIPHGGKGYVYLRLDAGAMSIVARCFNAVLRLIDRLSRIWDDAHYDHPLIQACDAPKPRTQEPCGRLFLGKGNRQYCSPVCQNRAGTRRFRTHQQPTAVQG
jgi:hypothetical protein